MFENILYVDKNKIDFINIYASYENIQISSNDTFVTNITEVDFAVISCSEKYKDVTRVKFEYDNDGIMDFSNNVPFSRRITFFKK